jgi:hypothetical protein
MSAVPNVAEFEAEKRIHAAAVERRLDDLRRSRARELQHRLKVYRTNCTTLHQLQGSRFKGHATLDQLKAMLKDLPDDPALQQIDELLSSLEAEVARRLAEAEKPYDRLKDFLASPEGAKLEAVAAKKIKLTTI